jgi:hypothetical protein
MSLSEEQIRLIDQRIRAARQSDFAAGTCVTRATTGPDATVMFDGSTVPMPVKVLGTVFCQADDRVVMNRYGSDWVVTGSWAGLGLGEASVTGFGPVGGTSVTVFTFIDHAGIPGFTFTKIYDNTFVRMAVTGSAYTNVTNSSVRFGLRLTAQDPGSSYAATDYNMVHIFYNQASVHLGKSSFYRALGIPAGSYTVQLRWRRYSGTGNTLFADDSDFYSIELDERVRQLTPFL